MSFMSNAVSAGMAVDSKTHWHDLEQAFVNESWKNSTQIAEGLKEQPAIGIPTDDITNWSTVEAWHAPALEISGVNYYKTEDQAIQFIFKDIDKVNVNGKYYHWNNNFWLSFFEYDKTTYQSYCIGVRCDNELKYRDPDTGKEYAWPCRIDNFATQSKFRETDYLITPNNNYTIVVQRNNYTERVCTLNRRFMFGGGGTVDNKRVFKIIGIQNSHKDSTANEANLLYLNMALDEIKEQDDFENGIAWNADALEPIQSTYYIITPEYRKLKQNIETIITVSTKSNSPGDWTTYIESAYGSQSPFIKIEPIGEWYDHKFKLTGKVIGKHNGKIKVWGERRDGAGMPEEYFDADIVSMIG